MGFLEEQERLDSRAPPAMRPTGPRVEVARGDDWSFMVWKSAGGFCVSYARLGGGSSRSCGRVPGAQGKASACLVVTLGTPAPARDGRGAICGLVTAAVSRIEIELTNGDVVSTQTLPATEVLGTDLRPFLIRTVFPEGPYGPGHPPMIRAYTSVGSDGRILERLAVS
jgi:hypothetical protein